MIPKIPYHKDSGKWEGLHRMNEDVVVIYHNNCYDGVTAAWVAHKKFGPGAQYVPMNYSDDLPLGLKDKKVFFIDFSLKRQMMNLVASQAAFLTVLDHHATAAKELEGLSDLENVTVIFDMERSGAGIAWDYFFGMVTRPDLVNYVEDRDLWRFKLLCSKEVNAFIQSHEIDLATWIEAFPYDSLSGLANSVSVGKALLRQQTKLVKEITANARMARLPQYMIQHKQYVTGAYGISVPTGVLFSEVCAMMLEQHPEAEFAWYSFYRVKDGKTQFGLRSREGSDVDVSAIAKLYGGGGHKHAAGFELSL